MMAGRELCWIKALSTRRDPAVDPLPRLVVCPIWALYKTRKMKKAGAGGSAGGVRRAFGRVLSGDGGSEMEYASAAEEFAENDD